MKKILAIILAALLALCVISCGKEDTTSLGDAEDDIVGVGALTYEDFEYGVNEDGDYEIIGFTYSGAETTTVEVPSEIEGRPVTGIGADAFKAATSITAITIPDSIEYIGDFAFYGCNGLTTVTLPDSVTTIGIGAFWGCDELTSITLSKNVTAIGDYAFWNCAKLSAITLPDKLETIGEGAFWSCDSLEKISVPASVTSIGRAAFMYCYALTEATINSATVEIGDKAFVAYADTFKMIVKEAAKAEGETEAKDSTGIVYAKSQGITYETIAA